MTLTFVTVGTMEQFVSEICLVCNGESKLNKMAKSHSRKHGTLTEQKNEQKYHTIQHTQRAHTGNESGK